VQYPLPAVAGPVDALGLENHRWEIAAPYQHA
jgi:hypothetical protein